MVPPEPFEAEHDLRRAFGGPGMLMGSIQHQHLSGELTRNASRARVSAIQQQASEEQQLIRVASRRLVEESRQQASMDEELRRTQHQIQEMARGRQPAAPAPVPRVSRLRAGQLSVSIMAASGRSPFCHAATLVLKSDHLDWQFVKRLFRLRTPQCPGDKYISAVSWPQWPGHCEEYRQWTVDSPQHALENPNEGSDVNSG